MTSITIWGAGTPRSMRPIWLAEELGLDYQLLPIGPRTGETQTPEFTQINRKQKIPFLSDGDIRLSESLAICRYLLSAYPNGQVYLPESREAKAKDDEWCCYIYGELDETSLYVMRRHGDLGEIYGASEQVVASAAGYLKRHLEVLADHLEAREYLVSEGFSLPDLLLTTCLDWATFYGVELPAPLATYREAITQRPAYLKAMQINYPDLFGGQNNGTA